MRWLMGDSVMFHPIIISNDDYDQLLFWTADPEQTCVRLTTSGRIYAIGVGQTYVTAISSTGLLSDTCLVNTFGERFNASEYPYDMVIYAGLVIDGKPADLSRTIVTAYCGNQLRGVSEVHEAFGVNYLLLRVYSQRENGDTLAFCCYNRDTYETIHLEKSLLFDGETHGSLSALYLLKGKQE